MTSALVHEADLFVHINSSLFPLSSSAAAIISYHCVGLSYHYLPPPSSHTIIISFSPSFFYSFIHESSCPITTVAPLAMTLSTSVLCVASASRMYAQRIAHIVKRTRRIACVVHMRAMAASAVLRMRCSPISGSPFKSFARWRRQARPLAMAAKRGTNRASRYVDSCLSYISCTAHIVILQS